MTIIKQDSRILFQGDSVTDCRRDRKEPAGLGSGYPLIVASMFPALFPNHGVEFINRGIGGNRAKDLINRWQTDCIDLKPDLLSIMIGINDTWRRYDAQDPTSTKQFAENYRQILKMTRENLDCEIILIEPYVLHVPADRLTWREDLDPKREVIRQLATEFKTRFIPMDELFAKAATQQSPAFWCPDGVHPSPAGHGLIAKAWLNEVQAL